MGEEEFIISMYPYCFKVLHNYCLSIFKRYDHGVVCSSAFESLQISYDKICQQNITKDRLKFGIVKKWGRWTLRKNLLKEGWIFDKRHTFAPTGGFVSLEEWNQPSVFPHSFCKYDLEVLIASPIFTETQRLVLKYAALGYEPVEIAAMTGYVSRHIHSTLRKIKGCLKYRRETDSIFAKKWGIVGPYGRRARVSPR